MTLGTEFSTLISFLDMEATFYERLAMADGPKLPAGTSDAKASQIQFSSVFYFKNPLHTKIS